MTLEPIASYGWEINDNALSIVWDSQENMAAVRERLSTLLKGCKCVTG